MNIRPLCVLVFAWFFLASSVVGKVALADAHVAADPLHTSRIDYHFVGHLEQFDDAGRLLVWEANIDGAFAGTMRWWFVNPPPVPTTSFDDGSLSFYEARWEIWSEGELLLAGESAGKTVFRHAADGIWDGNGVVTEARPEFNMLLGNRIYETGPVVAGSNPPVSYAGNGMFVIY